MGSYPLAGLAPVRIFYCCYSLVLNVGIPETHWDDERWFGYIEAVRLLVWHTDLSCCMFLVVVPTLAFSNFPRGTADAIFAFAVWGTMCSCVWQWMVPIYIFSLKIKMHCTHQMNTMLQFSSNLAPTVSGPFFNGSPTLFARKPMVLLVCHFLQHGLDFLTLVALEFANLIVFNGLHVWFMLCQYFKPWFYIYFFEK